MNEKLKEKINLLGAKMDTIESINNALISALSGADCLTARDAFSFVYLLENRVKDLKKRYEKLVKELKT